MKGEGMNYIDVPKIEYSIQASAKSGIIYSKVLDDGNIVEKLFKNGCKYHYNRLHNSETFIEKLDDDEVKSLVEKDIAKFRRIYNSAMQPFRNNKKQ